MSDLFTTVPQLHVQGWHMFTRYRRKGVEGHIQNDAQLMDGDITPRDRRWI